MLVRDVMQWRWACRRVLVGDSRPAQEWVRKHCPEHLKCDVPTGAAAFLKFGESLIGPHTFEAESRKGLERIYQATFGAREYDPDLDPRICECGDCANPGSECLYLGIPEHDRAFLAGFAVWCADHPEHLDSSVWLGEMAYMRHEARMMGLAARDQAAEVEDRRKGVSNEITRKHNMPWAVN